MDQWTLEEGDGNLKRDPLWRSKANVERIVPAPQQGSVQWYCRYIHLGKFHHDLTVTEPWKHG